MISQYFSVRLVFFLIINFGALALGAYFQFDGVTSDWYQNMNQAPWTPPGWVFGAAWTTIMICFSIYMAFLTKTRIKGVLVLYSIQLLLNTSWNLVFFGWHEVLIALVMISFLTIIVGVFLFKYQSVLKWKTLLITPYLIWLIIATSLNGYAFLMN